MQPELLYHGRFLNLFQRGKWEYVESSVAHGVVGIVAETAKGEIILIEQVRQPVGSLVIELPAGLAGDEGVEESLDTTAKRELEEETGYGGGDWKLLVKGATSPGLTSECVHLFQATNVEKIGAGEGVGGEKITTLLIPKSEVRAWLAQRAEAGALVDFRVYAGLWLAGVG